MIKVNDVLNLSINMSDEILIMGHKHIDLDALGSGLGLLKYCLDNNKKAHVFINPNEFNYSVLKAIELLPFSIKNCFITNLDNIKIDDKSLLIVLDTNSIGSIESIDIFDKFSNTFVLDHHEKSMNKLNATISYIDSSASSMVEIICDFLHSNHYQLNDKDIATIMYTGLCIDTNNFDSDTKENTFLSAAYLTKNGASISTKRTLFQERKEDILNRGRLLKRSTTIDDNTMVCVLDSNIYTPDELAKISNELLKFDKIDTSYTIGKTATNKVRISARCFDDKNVEEFMSLLGGGGHKGAAACELTGVTLQKAKEMLLSCISKQDQLDVNKTKIKK